MTSLPPIEVGSMEVSEAVELFSKCSDYDRAANQAKIEMIVQGLVEAKTVVHCQRLYAGLRTF